MPRFWFDSGESGYARRPYYAVKSTSFSTRTLQIFYMDTFFEDSGVSTGHDGDPEFQILEVHYSGGPLVPRLGLPVRPPQEQL